MDYENAIYKSDSKVKLIARMIFNHLCTSRKTRNLIAIGLAILMIGLAVHWL